MKVQDHVDDKVIRLGALSEDLRNSTPLMPDIKISEAGILNFLKNIIPKKGSRSRQNQELRVELALIIKFLFKRSLESGAVPLIWNSANFSPIFKKGINQLPPITDLFHFLCKVMKHIIASNLVRQLDSNGLMYDLQHGFRERRSCETQLVSLIEDLARTTSQERQTDLILLDFSKAFDKVNRSKLIMKLHSYGIRSATLRWI